MKGKRRSEPKDASARFPWGPLAALLVAMVLALAVARWETTRPPAPLPSRFQVSAWVPYWDQVRVRAALTAHAADLDEVNFYWYEVQADGTLSAFAGAEDATLLALARTHNLRVLPTVTNNFDGQRVAALLADEKTRTAHIRTIVALVERVAYDGIEVDYEALPEEARDDYSTFIEALARALHARNRLLSVTVHPKTDDPGTWDGPRAQDWSRLGVAADEMKVMAYDYHWSTSPPGPIAPLDWIDEMLTYAEEVIPMSKIWLGLPFYGRDWVEQNGKGLVWASADGLIQQHQLTAHRDPSSGEIFFSYTVGDTMHTVYIPDAQAIADKIRLARQRHPGIAGVAIWRLGGESTEHWAAIRRER
jgi:spore germination protein YaaH